MADTTRIATRADLLEAQAKLIAVLLSEDEYPSAERKIEDGELRRQLCMLARMIWDENDGDCPTGTHPCDCGCCPDELKGLFPGGGMRD